MLKWNVKLRLYQTALVRMQNNFAEIVYIMLSSKIAFKLTWAEGSQWAHSMGLEPASVRTCVRPSTLWNMNISETSCTIKIKFHLEHHLGGGLTVLGFGQDRIRTLVSMATDSSHRVIMGKILWPFKFFIFDWFFFILAGNEDNHKISNGFKFGKIGPGFHELIALERLEKSP